MRKQLATALATMLIYLLAPLVMLLASSDPLDSMLGKVAAVVETESPSHPRPVVIQRT